MKLIKVSTQYDIYKSDEKDFSKNRPIAFVNNKVFYRFMNCLYIPDHVYKLPPDYVKELNNVREKFALSIIDQEFNDLVISTTLTNLSESYGSNSVILDFGCGYGYAGPLIKRRFPNAKLFGVDIRKPLKKKLLELYSSFSIQQVDSSLPFSDNFFDIIVSFFVFHFYVSDNQIAELSRVIKKNGTFFLNLINSADFEVLDRIHKAGFELQSEIEFSTAKNSGRGYFYVLKNHN